MIGTPLSLFKKQRCPYNIIMCQSRYLVLCPMEEVFFLNLLGKFREELVDQLIRYLDGVHQ